MPTIARYPSPLSAPLSKAVRAGNFIFLSGQTPKNPDLTPFRGSVAEQTVNIMETIKATLVELGADLGSIVRAMVWLSDIESMPMVNNVYRSYVGDSLPARTCVQAQLSQGVDVEIEVTAWLPTEAV